ncbi:MAG: chloride channel protein [Dermatophilaceae bacterium]
MTAAGERSPSSGRDAPRRRPAGRLPAELVAGQPNVPLVARGLLTTAPRFWLVLVITGVGAGLGGAALTLLLRSVQVLSFGYAEESFLQGVEQASAARRVVVLTLAGLLVGLGGWGLTRAFRSTSGISEALWLPGRRMRFVPTALDCVLQIVTVAMGSSLGREGAPKELGAVIGERLAKITGLPPEQRRVLLAAGAGAGMAAVYNVPLGGGLFAAEVLLGAFTLPLVLPVLLTAVIGTVVAWVVVPQAPIYAIPKYGTTPSMIVWAAVFGPVAGLVAAAFVRLLTHAKARQPRGWRLPLVAVPVFAALGALSIAYPEVLGNGKGPAQLAFDGAGSLPLLAALVVLKPLATTACLRAGATGGLFTPSLAIGAVLGGATAYLWTALWPSVGLGAFAVVGGAALLAAATQGPVSSVVLVFELTHVGPSVLVPMLLAVVGATLTARWLGPRSIYTPNLPPEA